MVLNTVLNKIIFNVFLMEEKFLFKGKSFILLVLLIALLAFLPVSANDNMTSDDLCSADMNQSFENSGELSSVDVAPDNLSNSNFDDSLGDTNISYHRIATKLYSEKFSQNAIDSKAGEKGGIFSVFLFDENGSPLSNKSVIFGFNGVSHDVSTNEVGSAGLQINLAKCGQYTFAVAYLGDDYYDASFDVYTVKITKKPTSITAKAKTFKSKAKTKKYTVTLKTVKSKNGKSYLSAGKKITLKLKGKTYSAKTNSKGKATFSLKITKKGKFKSTIKYAGDKTYASASKSVKITIK